MSRCEICGDTAAQGTESMKDVSQPQDEWRTFMRSGVVQWRCWKHPLPYQPADGYPNEMTGKFCRDGSRRAG